MAENGGGRHTRIVGFQIAYLFLEGIVELSGLSEIGAAGREESVEAGFLVVIVPFFNSAGSIMLHRAVRRGNTLKGGITKESVPGFIVICQAGNEWGNGRVAH